MVDYPEYYYALEDENDDDLVRYDVINSDGLIEACWLLNENFTVVEYKPFHLKDRKMKIRDYTKLQNMIRSIQQESPRKAYVATRDVSDSLDSASVMLDTYYPNHTPADAIALTALILSEMANFNGEE